MTTSHGLCECGCGEKTRLATETNRSKGQVAGQPRRFINGHAARTLSRVLYLVDEDTGCWVWQRAVNPNGYPVAGTKAAHRAYYVEKHGSIPAGLEIDHLCSNTRCVNPDHLEAVTSAENTRRSQSAKLTVEQVREIRASSLPSRDIAGAYGVHHSTVRGIRRGESWKNA